jgi:ribosome-binding protein aMBF1 (putative translation factor)
MNKIRVCEICGTRLAGKKGHGFVINNGKTIVCGDYRRHERIKNKRKYNYGEEAKEAAERKAAQEALTDDWESAIV